MTLRPWTADDAEALAAICDDELVYRFTPLEPPFTPKEATERIALLNTGEERRTSYSRAIVLEHEPVGELGAYGRRPGRDGRVMDVSWVIGAQHRGRGIATVALGPFIAELQPAWRIDQFVADIAPENIASQRVASACGFTPDDTDPAPREGRSSSAVPWRLHFT